MSTNKRKRGVDERFLSSLGKLNLEMNANNVVNVGVGYVPLFVIFTLGLGNTYGFPIQPNEINLDEFKLALGKIGDEIAEYGSFRKWKAGANRILEKIINGESRVNNFQKSEIQKFIQKQFTKTVDFLDENVNILVSQADKGGKVVIMDRSLYDAKMKQYLEECTNNHTYFKCDSLSLDDVCKLIEDKYGWIRVSLNDFL